MYSIFPIAAALSLDAVTAGKVLVLLTAVYTILLSLKKALPAIGGPAIGGWFALALNIVLAVIGAVVILPVGQFFSVETLTIAIVAGITAAGAAGIHGTVSKLGPPASSSSSGSGQAGFALLSVVHRMILRTLIG